MNKTSVQIGLLVGGMMVAAPLFAGAASASALQNAGLSQQSGNTTGFSLAVCNKGTDDVRGPVMLTVNANGVTAQPSIGSLNAGACGFANLTYAAFNMAAGQRYPVQVSIAPDTLATYSLTVPGGKVLGASTVNAEAERQAILEQLAYIASVAKALQAIIAQMHF